MMEQSQVKKCEVFIKLNLRPKAAHVLHILAKVTSTLSNYLDKLCQLVEIMIKALNELG